MLELFLAVLKLVVSTQVTILQHLIFLHRAVGSPKENMTVLNTYIGLLQETNDVLEKVVEE